MKGTVRRFLERWGDDIYNVVFVVASQEDYDLYYNTLKFYFPRNNRDLLESRDNFPSDIDDINEFGAKIIKEREIRIAAFPGSSPFLSFLPSPFLSSLPLPPPLPSPFLSSFLSSSPPSSSSLSLPFFLSSFFPPLPLPPLFHFSSLLFCTLPPFYAPLPPSLHFLAQSL